MREELTPIERVYVRKSIEQHKLGTNRVLLKQVRFECEKLILVGDPKQLPPTIQGSDAAHGNGLEQTLFDRLCLM
ncbi:rCG28398, partial [Rattus norvegicus]